MPDEQDSREIQPDEAIIRLGEALETCRSVVADYRAALVGSVANEPSVANGEGTQAPTDANSSG